MAKILLASDNNYGYSNDVKTLNKVAELLRQKGHTVTTNGIGPNQVQQLANKQSGDVMLQIAGGKCFGTLGDFYYGNYKATKRGFLYHKTYDPNWKCHREPRDNFSWKLDLKKWEGKPLSETLKDMKPKIVFGYGNTAEEMVNTFIQDFTGNSSSSNASDTGGGGSSILDCIKQILSDLDMYGIDFYLDGDTVVVRKTNINNAVPLTTDNIVGGTITVNDYNTDTPNTNGTAKDTYLINRFGQIPLDTDITTDREQVLLMAQRGYGHTIEVKVIMNEKYLDGTWVKLTIPELGIADRLYYITKLSYDEEMVFSLTLEPGPPSLYVEQEVIEEDSEELEDDVDEEV